MDDNDIVIEHLNVYKTIVSEITSISITMVEEDKSITILCYFSDSWDNLIFAIGSANQSTLKFDEKVSSLLLEEMRWKTMDNHSMDALSVRGLPQERNKNKGSGGRSKFKGRSKSPRKGIRKCWKCGKAGHYCYS